MGAKHSKVKEREGISMLTSEEKEKLQMVFRSICYEDNRQNDCSIQAIRKFWSPLLAPTFLEYIMNYFQSEPQVVTFERFAALFASFERGSVDDKIKALQVMLKIAAGGPIFFYVIEHYISGLVRSYIKIQDAIESKELLSLQLTKCPVIEDDRWVEYCCSPVPHQNGIIDLKDLEIWVMHWKKSLKIQDRVFYNMYHMDRAGVGLYYDEAFYALVPFCKLPSRVTFPISSALDFLSIVFVNSHLPMHLRSHWRLLYSSGIHGESFSQLVSRITDCGPTVVVVKDRHKRVFGGFASVSWKPLPRYIGDRTCFLFSLYPLMRIYESSGTNENYQYLNKGTRESSGFGFGGQFTYYGLWIDSSLVTGFCSGQCSTFADMEQLSYKKHFKISNVEIWRVGQEVDIKKRSMSIFNLDQNVCRTDDQYYRSSMIGTRCARTNTHKRFTTSPLTEEDED